MKFKGILLAVLSLLALQLTGCANLGPKPTQVFPLVNPKTVTVIVPDNKEVDGNVYTTCSIRNAIWAREYYQGQISRQQLIRVQLKTGSSFDIDRRVDNGVSGSGTVYSVNYSLKHDHTNTILQMTPTQRKTYQGGLIMSWEPPTFTEEDLFSYLCSQQVGYRVEINSEFNTESIFSNFKRLATEEQFRQGEKDDVTGKIFKNRFSMMVDDTKVYFSVETFPYRNGTKAIIYLSVPGRYTSENTVDFNVILKDLKTKLEAIINA
ncbi:hypothetical protein [Citrifermentans bremense]|uniref:hypothetical protein n=1 Tax=Citrifermentans bremense TaxID=60035 RepID=UPI00040FE044|nr:hypothetical protein [Citrifermentans bremense]